METTTVSGHELAFKMGRVLLENGAEISRVQETMERVAAALGVEEFNTYVLTNAVFAEGIESGNNHRTRIKFVPSFSIHFGRIAAVNQLSRQITAGDLSAAEAYEKLLEIEALPYTRVWKQILACGVGSAGFCYMFGGNLADSLNALLCGFLVQAFLSYADKHKFSKFVTNICASGIAALFALLILKAGLGAHLDVIITGSIIRLVPGIALTTSIRDFFNGDYLSGTIRLIDAVIVGGCIAIGVGVVISLSSYFLGGAVI